MPDINELDYWEFSDKYQLQVNHIVGEQQASYDGFMYETFGEEVEYIYSLPESRVWTLLDDGDTVIRGRHRVNRLGYFVLKESAA